MITAGNCPGNGHFLDAYTYYQDLIQKACVTHPSFIYLSLGCDRKALKIFTQSSAKGYLGARMAPSSVSHSIRHWNTSILSL